MRHLSLTQQTFQFEFLHPGKQLLMSLPPQYDVLLIVA